jgi:hypothetical protein
MRFFRVLVSSYKTAMNATKEAVIRAMMGVLIFLGYVLLSLFMYAILRRVMVPQKLHIKPVHLFFHPECQMKEFSNCPFPKAEFLLNDGKKLLSSGQYYHVSLQLQAPESPVNEDIGVFMVNITLYTTAQQFLSTSARLAMVKYKSSLLHTLSTVVFSMPLLLGLWHQEQEVDVTLYEAYYEPYGDGAISATVTILNSQIQLYSARLTIDANFGGFTYYLYQWPVTMSVIVVISIFISLCTCTLVLWIRDVLRDYDTQRRRRGLQRQQMTTAGAAVVGTQQQQQQQGGGRGERPRGPIMMPRPPHSATVGATDLPPYPQGADNDRATPTPSDISVSTGTGVEDVTTSSQMGSAVSEMSSVAGDTDTETEAGGISDLLHILRQVFLVVTRSWYC